MTSLHNLYPKHRAHASSRIHRRRYSPQSFVYTVLLFSLLGLAGYVYRSDTSIQRHADPYPTLNKRQLGAFASSDEECRLVHQATDQCRYITKHCPDEDPGFYSYLSLFYCRMPHAKPLAFLILVSWLGLLFSTIGIAASDFFCINLSTIATILGMSESMAGVTFLAFGNGSPDVFSTFAAFSTNSSSLAIGELFGAAGFITAVVAGSMALVRPFKVAKKAFIRDVGFFTVAAAFSLSFLWDGTLHLWECITMVLFYIFYVAFVVAWHWWMGVRRRRHERIAAARGHFVVPGSEEVDAEESYHDIEDEEPNTRPSFSRGPSVDDFSALERGDTPHIVEPYEDEDDDEARDRWLGELKSNMRLTRPGPGSRRNTLTPIRPSLVGALEFQAVLKSLQKTRQHQTIPMHTRRYSDDPTYTTVQQQEQLCGDSDPAARPPFHATTEGNSPTLERPALDVFKNTSGRTRAVSANDAAHLRIDPRFVQKHTPNMMDIVEDEDNKLQPPSARPASFRSMPSDRSRRPHTPEVTVSDFDDYVTSSRQDPEIDASEYQRNRSTSLISAPAPDMLEDAAVSPTPRSRLSSPSHSPRTFGKDLYNLKIPASSQISPNASAPSSPFPAYYEPASASSSRPPSLYLPPASVSVASYPPTHIDDEEDERPLRWWPYKILPPPLVLLYRLLPTIEHWRNKNWWERLLAVVAAPSMFLLIVTLPVVESDREEIEEEIGILDNTGSHAPSIHPLDTESPISESHVSDYMHASAAPGGGSAAVATHIERDFLAVPGEHDPLLSAAVNTALPSPHPSSAKIQPQYWNRWLTIVQLFLAPLLIVVVIYTQYLDDETDGIRTLIRPMLISLLVSVVLLIPLLLTTTPTHRPKPYNTILSMAGFVVSIAWISTIASQVVAVLKALAVIMNMSHAIMGLTIFAVGNSLGDLVADITVARLGYPIMALSACLGGPMLNILLGIGLSGSWILIRGAEHRHQKHPGKPIKFRTYEIEVGQTLIVSGVTLLITLIGLLIAVPMNKWILSRKIGWILIGVWCVSTTVNVVLEVLGVGEAGGEE